MNDTDYGAVFLLVACIGVVAILGIFLTIPPSHPANTLPAGCGVSENQSETYTTHYFIMAGHVMIPETSTHNYNDLFCTNGTTVLEWSEN